MRILLAIAMTMLAAPAAFAQQADLVYAMYFRSDWCPNCRILEPNLESARQGARDLPIGYVVVDLSASEADYQISLGDLLDKGLARPYNQYLGLTGFVMYLAADTGEVLECATRLNDSSSIIDMEVRAVQSVRSQPPYERSPGGLATCPPPLRQPPPPLH